MGKHTTKTKNCDLTKPSLTKREKQILNSLIEDNSNKQISENLEISTNTVKFHLKNLYKKLNINKRSEVNNISLN